MTVPGGVPNLPVGALTLDTLASKLQDMTPAGQRGRVADHVPNIFDTSTGGNVMSDSSPFGVIAQLFSGFSSQVALADPADIQGPDDLPGLLVDFIESLPMVSRFLNLWDAIKGTYTGTDPTLLEIKAFFVDIDTAFSDLAADITAAVTDAYQQVLDFLTGITGSTAPQQNTWLNDLLTVASTIPDANVPGLQAIQDAMSQAWSGLESVTGTAVSDAKQFMQDIRAEILSHTRQLQSLQSSATGSRYAGKTFDVDFADYPDGPLPALFNTTYFGTGTSTLVVDGGVAAWNLVNDNNRGADVMYTVPTDTDYQVVRGSMASPPTQTGTGGTPRIWSWVRADSPTTPANGVFARAYSPSFGTYRGDIGCRVAGVDTVWASNIALTWSLDMTVVAGVGATAKSFEVYSGDTLVKRFPNPAIPAEVTAANLSQIGPSFRYWGSRTEMKTGLLGAIGPGTIKGVSATDNLPPTLLGPTAEMYRTSTTAVSFPNGWARLPNNFWQVVARASSNIEASTVTGSFTIKDEGNYTISTSIRIGSNITVIAKLGLWLNGALLKVTPNCSGGSIAAGEALSATWEDYFVVDDVIEVATYHNGITGNYIQAESTGMETWFTVTGSNRSYL